jgi:hypothetical protein
LTHDQHGIAELVRTEAVLRDGGGHPVEYRIFGEDGHAIFLT